MPADMFYFQGPAKPQIVHQRQHILPCAKRATAGKRRNRRMATMSTRAMMARFDEPIFCPSNIAALVNQYPTLLPGTAELSSTAATSDLPSDGHISDDGDGGVSLMESRDLDIPDALEARVANAAPGTQRSMNASRRVLSFSHPRPDTPDIWDEENLRRLRIALDGDDVGDVTHVMQPDDTPAQNTQPLPNDSEMTVPDGNVLRQLQHSLIPQTIPIQTSNHPDPPRTTTAADDDLLDVDDDQSRNPDVVNFLESWRLRSLADSNLPSFCPDITSSVGLWPSPELVVQPRDTQIFPVDVQGIRWGDIGTTRAVALDARRRLYSRQRQDSTVAKDQQTNSPSGFAAAYRFRSFVPKHRAHICHYQLRNSIAATSRSDIFYADRSRVLSTSLASPSSQNLVMHLAKPHTSAANFRVTCLAASSTSSNNLLFAGGFLGEYAMLNLDADTTAQPIEGFVTHAYNGLVTHIETSVGRSSGLPQATFCSNDKKVRMFDAATARLTDSFSYAHAVNCSAISTDLRLRLLVGDTHDSCITTAERGDVVVNLSGHTDHAFACAWAPNGVNFATGSQDGRTLVWDARKWTHPCIALDSTLSCPRSLHFADDNSLIAAESEDVFSVYNISTFERRQEIKFFGAIAGVAVLDGGAEIVVANSDKTVGGLLAFERTGSGGREGAWRNSPPDIVRSPPRKSCNSMLDSVVV